MTKIWMVLPFLPALASAILAQTSPPTVSVTRWPQDRASAISLTFDDGINSDLDHVGPILKRHHLNGTFFVTTGTGPWEARKSEWKKLAVDGNELGNHTVHHPCLLPQITPHSQDYTPEMMEAEIKDAAREIQQTTNTQRGLTFAYPCGNMSFGRPPNEVRNFALYLLYVAETSFGARAAGVGGADGPENVNVLAVNDLGPTAGKDFAALLDLARPAFQRHNWGVYCFHGVGGDWLSIAPEALDGLASYLEQHSDIWTATFGDVLRYIEESKAAGLRITHSDKDSVSVSLSWPMEKKIYDVPLTLKVEVPQAWTEATATGDGKTLTARITDQTKGTVILIDVPSQTAELRIAGR
jgi:peptidoglycan/xylan/chitin deacetylase (PgdA/CDA1 family)